MKNFIEEFYYGNIEPQEFSADLAFKAKKQLSILTQKEEELREKLPDKTKNLLENYECAYNEFSSICNADSFISGFRLGARFTNDTFINNNKG